MTYEDALKYLTATINARKSFMANAPKDSNTDTLDLLVANAAKDFVVAYKNKLDAKKSAEGKVDEDWFRKKNSN